MSEKTLAAKEALRRSRSALRKGNKDIARAWAEKATLLAPNLEDAWLLLAATSRPQLSLRYLERALAINPQSKHAQKGMIWAKTKLAQKQKVKVLFSTQEKAKVVEKTQPTKPISEVNTLTGIPFSTPKLIKDTQPNKAIASQEKPRFWRQSLPALIITVVLVSLVWATFPRFVIFAEEMSATPSATIIQEHWGEADINKPTYTPSPTATFTPTLTPTNTATPTSTSTPTETPLPTATPYPTKKPAPPAEPEPEYIPSGEKYVLVDISEQRLYAYQGNTLVYSFIASTGMNGGTATGNFSVLNKIPSAYGSTWDIWMPSWLGIYWAGSLQNGIHALPIMSNGATLWAGYLGTPISYGCVVLGSYEASLLYNWVNIGTPVNIQW
ncbi:MAG: L,D-transpeptidase family protein [Anaerolineae bacterium]|jgi:lipoprotein-anchoring transpeptidase ErfK/SrfK|nr:L,D-transpeptidase family protein [Anaerolineae bacterium]